MITDRWPMPFSSPVAMLSTLAGLITLAFAHSFPVIRAGRRPHRTGSAIFHPEASRVARLASGGRHGLAQSMFQVGGNTGSAIGPLLAAFIIIPRGQQSLSWFAGVALTGFVVLTWIGVWHARHRRGEAGRRPPSRTLPLARGKVLLTLAVLVTLTATKNAYLASISSYFTFYTIEKFGLDVQSAQMLLFLFRARRRSASSWEVPLAIASARSRSSGSPLSASSPSRCCCHTRNCFGQPSSSSSSVLCCRHFRPSSSSQELAPGRVGLIGGLFFGLAFGFGGIAAAVLGVAADREGIEHVYRLCSYLPLLGLLTVMLPNLPQHR